MTRYKRGSMKLRRCRRKVVSGSILPFFCATIMLTVLMSCATEPVREDQRKGLAVWDMEDLSPIGSRLDIGELLSARVVETIRNRGDYTVVERAQLLRVLEELHIGSSSLADEQTRLRVGKLLGARFMVFGGYQTIGGTMRLDLRLVDVETGKIRKAVKKTAPSSNITECLDTAGKAAAEL